MKYKSAVFAVHTDGKTPAVDDAIMALCHSAFFAYDLEKMACICFVILPEMVDENTAREIIPFYMGYEIDTKQFENYYKCLELEISYLNGDKMRPTSDMKKAVL